MSKLDAGLYFIAGGNTVAAIVNVVVGNYGIAGVCIVTAILGVRVASS